MKTTKNLLYNIIIYPFLSICGVLLILIGIFCYFWINIGNYQELIKKLITTQVGMYISFDKIHGTLTSNFQPTLKIDNLFLSKSNNPIPFLKLHNLTLTLSFTSLYKLKPIFSQALLDGANIILEYDKNNNLIVNHQLITNLKSENKFNIDIQGLLLLQQHLSISNLDLTIIDSKHKLNPIVLDNINIIMQNQSLHHYIHYSSLFAKSNTIEVTFDWNGGSLSNISKWNNGTLIAMVEDKLYHKIDVRAKVLNGLLEFLNADFNTNNKQLPEFNNAVSSDSATVLSGKINIIKKDATNYTILGKNLMLSTASGVILNNAIINGNYENNKYGSVSINEVNLDGIEGFKLIQLSNKLKFRGILNHVKFIWSGSLTNLSDFAFSSNFKEIAISSIESGIPSFDHLNGDVNIKQNSGILHIQLDKSMLIYPNQLKHPVFIEKFKNTSIWSTSPRDTKITWTDTVLQTKDISLTSTGTYNTLNHQIKTFNQISFLDIPAVFNSLYKESTDELVGVIQTYLPDGYLSDAKLMINGNLESAPYKNGVGELQFSAHFKNGVLNFASNLVTVTHLVGDIMVHNQHTNIKISNGNLGKYLISKSLVDISDTTANNPLLTFDGYASGKSEDILSYLKTTTFKDKINKLDLHLYGDSRISVRATLPTNTPEKTILTGQLSLQNNSLIIGSDMPKISNLSGMSQFSDKGIGKSSFTANVFNSNIKVNFSKQKVLEITSPNLDYHELIKFLSPNIANIISGMAFTKMVYDNNSAKLSVFSNLYGVNINAPEPLGKRANEYKNLLVALYSGVSYNNISINYADELHSMMMLNSKMQLLKAKVALGTKNLNLANCNDNYAPITLNIMIKDTYVMPWLELINKIISIKNNKATTMSFINIYPIVVNWHTGAIWINNYNIDGGNIHVLINKDLVSGMIDIPDIYGQFKYNLNNNKVKVELNKLLLSSNNLVDLSGKLYQQKSVDSSVSKTNSVNNIPDIQLYIHSLYLQNHYLGIINAKILQRNNNLYIESATLVNKSGQTLFRVIEHNINATTKGHQYTEIRLKTNISNFSKLLSKLDVNSGLQGGNGNLDILLAWVGGISNFNIENTVGYVDLHIKNGVFTRIDPGLLGSVLGVVSLTSVVDVSNLNLNTFFGKGFGFDSWDMWVQVKKSKLQIKNFKIVGSAATIKEFGGIDLKNKTIDSYLTVEPRLGATVATTAGIVTLNPFVGILVYVGEALIGNPVNRLLALSYYIHGSIDNPTINSIKVTKQIQQNFNSTTNIFQTPSSVLDIQINQ